MRTWLAALLAGCDGSDDKPRPEPGSPEPTGGTGHTGLSAPFDSDGDGFVDEEDCQPSDPLAFPGAVERCNGLDDNCDGQPDPYIESDGDGDGFLWCEDCDDLRIGSYPGAPDPFGDQTDSDCDGTDGQGTTLPAPFRVGQSFMRTAGLALAGGDIDGDGCAELLIGEPGGYANYTPQHSAASLGVGCAPWSEGLRVRELSSNYLGYNVDLAPGLVVVHENGWWGYRGRLLVFDETFAPEAEPLLEIRGGIYRDRWVHSIAVLGEPAQWLLIGMQGGPDNNSAFQLIDASRRGVVDFELDEPDLFLDTSTANYHVGIAPGDVGDRDGDGEVDLAVVGEMGNRPGRFFPQVVGGHVDDAPEIWTEGEPGGFAQQLIRSGGDLDGDGRSDAVLTSLFAEGEEETAGRAYVVPYLGPGEWRLEDDAPTRLDGEFTLDWFGLDNEVTDLDTDGHPDLVISAPSSFSTESRPGKVLVYPGPLPPGVLTAADAALLWVGEQQGDHAGGAIATGDFDGSGRGDIAIGAPFADRDGLTDAGAVYVLIDPL